MSWLGTVDDIESAGSHVLLDYVNYKRGETGDGEWVLSVLRESVRDSGVREVHSHVEIFDGVNGPPGFAAVVLIDESHVTAHCYSERGILAIDVITCGDSAPSAVAAMINDALVSEIPGLRRVFEKRVERFRSD